MRQILAVVPFAFLLTSCLSNNREEANSGVDPNMIFHDYKITAEEGLEDVTVMVQCRLGGKDGTPVLLEEPSKLSLDGAMLYPDSAKLAGAFYEKSLPVTSFAGEHTLVFTDSRKKQHTTKFQFEPFDLAQEIPDRVSKKPLLLKLSNFPAKPTNVRLVMFDTSFVTPDINEELLVEHGEIRIDETRLANLANGPITLEIYREEEKTLKGISRKGGRVFITYSLRRQFEFTD